MLLAAPLAGAVCIPFEDVVQNPEMFDCNGQMEEGRACCALKCPADMPNCVRPTSTSNCPDSVPTPMSECYVPAGKKCNYNLHCQTAGSRRKLAVDSDFEGCMFTTFAECASNTWQVAMASGSSCTHLPSEWSWISTARMSLPS